MQSLVLLQSHRVLGHSLTIRSPPSEPFNSPERGRRGASYLKRSKFWRARCATRSRNSSNSTQRTPQMTTLSTVCQPFHVAQLSVLIFEFKDPLAFRPNPEALVGTGPDDNGGTDGESQDEIYRP